MGQLWEWWQYEMFTVPVRAAGYTCASGFLARCLDKSEAGGLVQVVKAGESPDNKSRVCQAVLELGKAGCSE